jgi:carbon starvation protein CstA
MKDEFARVWKFVGISNQVLACVICWTIAMYLAINGKNHLMLSIPALFLTAVCITYIFTAPHSGGGLALSLPVSLSVAAVGTVAVLTVFLVAVKKKKNGGK